MPDETEPFLKRVNREGYACGHTDVDEIVAHDCNVHLERMSARYVWIGLRQGNGETAHVRIASETPINVIFETEGNPVGQETWHEHKTTWEEQAAEELEPPDPEAQAVLREKLKAWEELRNA